MACESGPILSTPAKHILEELSPGAVFSREATLSDEQLYLQYEIKRTVHEICRGKWKRIALQFPDDMLVHSPRVFERLRAELSDVGAHLTSPEEPVSSEVADSLHDGLSSLCVTSRETNANALMDQVKTDDVEERLCILADTSYGACCVDEIAAEHINADVVVHYGRACLSPTARLPVIYVFTTKPIGLDATLASFTATYPDRSENICLMADIPYHHHLPELAERARRQGYTNVFSTEIVRDPSSLLPNRSLPAEIREKPEKLKDYSIFHVSSPPTSLLLILSSRVKRIHVFLTEDGVTPCGTALEASTAQLLRRRYALLTRLSTVSIFGILINTLSVANYMAALQHCQELIRGAGKKFYVFVVGKLNAAKIANFSEIGGWVVIGCWESSLVESKDFYKPIITPFELEMALTEDKDRVWGAEWVGDFSQLLGRDRKLPEPGGKQEDAFDPSDGRTWDDATSEDEPPEFDLRTGTYISRTRPMGRRKPATARANGKGTSESTMAPPSSAVVQRARGDLAAINGTISPAAEFLRSNRTWQGLGTDHQITYERDEEGRIRGAGMEEGKSGIARGYAVGDEEVKS